jgi:cell division protein FtsL
MKPQRIRLSALALVAVVGLMLVYVWKGNHGRSLAAQVDQLRIERQELIDVQDQLRTEIVSLTSIDRIKRIAVEDIGLVDPTDTPVDVTAVAPLGSSDSLDAARATGLEVLPRR